MPAPLNYSEPRVAGKRGRRPSPATPELHLRNFAAAPSKPPPSGDVTSRIHNWGMLGNDQYGDCGPAATEHYRMAKAGTVNVSPAATDAYTEQLYFAYGKAMGESGDKPDEGVDNATWLKFLFDKGLILAYARLDASDADEVHQAMLNFNGVLIGCSLTDDAEQDFEATPPVPWTITAQDQPDPQEGHDILLAAYDADGETFVTWAALMPATVAWETGEAHAGDLEAWVILTPEDAERNGVDVEGLRAQIQAWGGTVAPEPAPEPSPAPQPPTPPIPAPEPTPEPTPVPEPGPTPIEHAIQQIKHWLARLEHLLHG